MNLSYQLKKSIAEALQSIYDRDFLPEKLHLSPTEKNFEGTHTLTTFSLAGSLKSSPQEVAEKVGQWLVEHGDWVVKYQVVKGFLNLTLSDTAWQRVVESLEEALMYQSAPTGKHVVVEFSQPNTNKPLHLGHLRNNFLGTALSNILEAAGDKVERVNIMNDRGIHICKSMIAYERFGKGRTPASEGMKGDHFVGHYYVLFEKEYQREIQALVEGGVDREQAKKEASIMLAAQAMLEKWEAGDAEVVALWKRMNGWVFEGFEVTYKRTDTTFDKIYYESDTYLLGKKVVREGLEKGIFEKRKDGSVWIDLEDKKLDHKLVLRSNGTTVYITQDMGAIDQRYEAYTFDEHIYVVGSEQDRHFEVLFEIMRRLGRRYADKLYHLSYGMVDLPSGKMKSREGTTVDADRLIDEMVTTAEETTRSLGKVEGLGEEEAHRLYDMLGVGAIKYFLLRVNPKKRILFNPEDSIDFQGKTASFIQYTHARICTMLRKAGYDKAKAPQEWKEPVAEAEKSVILQLSGYREALEHAAKTHNPALLADYAYQLAKVYNHLYATLPMMRAEKKEVMERRLYLSWVTSDLIKRAMALLGIQVPESM